MRNRVAVVCAVAAAALLAGAAPAVAANVISGTPQRDVIWATAAADVIFAGSGDDKINNLGSGDVVWAGSGNDTITVAPLAELSGIVIEGNVGNDRVEAAGAVFENSYVNGDSGNDTILLNGCGNRVVAGTGNDRYENRRVCVGSGDNASLGNGDDTVVVHYARSVLLGNGNDTLRTIFPRLVEAGSGADFVRFDQGGNAEVGLGAGNDRLQLATTDGLTVFGSGGTDLVTGRGSRNRINTQSGADQVDLPTRSFDNVLDGGPNRDLVRLTDKESRTTCVSVETVTDFGGNQRDCR